MAATSSILYRSNVRDVLFNLFESLQIDQTVLGQGEFSDWNADLVRETVRQVDRLSREELSKSFYDADRIPLSLDLETGTVGLPESLKRTIETYYRTDMHLLRLPVHLGGMGAPPSVAWSTFEFEVGANATAAFYYFGSLTARMIDKLGTPAQKQRFVQPMLDHRWGGTMVLTEPDAGSDVGAGRAKATHLHDDVWSIEGVKRFITNGDYDAVDNIVHLVLARPVGAGPGTKGLSMFIVPKFWVNEDGSVGERNGAYCTNIEKKMGLKGSATCEMTFGERHIARGFLMGDVHDGIRQMFHLIEWARMSIGLKSAATLSSAYLHALDYAKNRLQGPDLTRATDKTAPRVPILAHPDVRRMLMLQKAYAEGMRALTLYASTIQDGVELAKHSGNKADQQQLEAQNDLLLPIIKGFCSDRTWDLLSMSLQCLGGSGYTQDYPIEQYIRDQKIDTLYEGTTHIQALDLLLRKVARDGGATLRMLLAKIRATAQNTRPDGLDNERALLLRALGDVEGIFGALLAKMNESMYHVGLQANRVLSALGELCIGWFLVSHAEIALRNKAAAPHDAAFYDGKVASARFFAATVLPSLTLARKLVEQSTLDLMALPEECF